MGYELAVSATLFPIKNPRAWTNIIFGHDPHFISKLPLFPHP